MSIVDNKSFVYTTDVIQARATKTYQTHHSKITTEIYHISTILTKPLANGIHDILVLKRKGEGFGAEFGPGGESKRFKVITAAAWLGLALVTLPLVILGIIGKQVCHPGQGDDKLVFMNAAEPGYTPPVIHPNDPIFLATCNVAWLPSPVDAIKDVYDSPSRGEELAKFLINNQEDDSKFLCIGLQEAFDSEASRAFTNGIKRDYPYAITNAGWANIPFLGSNSGLQFHSRVPIKTAAFYPFQDLVGFGVKCSDRGLLKVELDLGNGNSAMVYVTHLQAHAEHKNIRKNELEAITKLMQSDQEKNPCNGHYYLMGDLNVSNVDDESLKRIGELDEFLQEGEPLSVFYDPLPAHGPGTFYRGADQLDRGRYGYGTSQFIGEAVDDCRYDYILRLGNQEGVSGLADIIDISSNKFQRCPLSDHKMVVAGFKNEGEN